MNAQQLALYATNEGKLYNRHLELARENAPPVEWRFHIRNAVLPMYRRTFNEPWEGMCQKDIEKAGKALAEYYWERILECEEDEPEHPAKPERRGVYSKA